MAVSVPAIPPAPSLPKSSLGWKGFGITAGSSLLGQHTVALPPSLFPGLWGLVNNASVSTSTPTEGAAGTS